MIPSPPRYRIEFYRTSRGEEPVRRFLDELDRKLRIKAGRWLGMLEEYGPNLPRPYADVLDGPIRELRVGHGRLSVRLLYFFHANTIIVLAHGFLKKTDAVPPGEIEAAHRARLNWILMHGSDA